MQERPSCPACAISAGPTPPSSLFSSDDNPSLGVCRHNCSVAAAVAARQRCENLHRPVRMRTRPRSSCPTSLLSLAVVSFLAVAPSATHAFSAELSRHVASIETKTKSSSENVRLVPNGRDVAAKRRRAAKLQEKQTMDEDVEQEEEDAECNDFARSRGGGAGSPKSAHVVSRRSTASSTTALAASVSSLGDDFQDQDIDAEEDEDEDNEPTVLSCLRPLIKMTRPSNFPGVILFHILGVHRALSAGLSSSSIPISYSKSLLLETLRKPQMVIVLLALLLTSATSMVVNDYYDARSGTDARNLLTQALQKSTGKEDNTYNHLDKPLATGDVPMIVAKRFLSYLYAALLVCLCAVPGMASRLTVVVAAMLTFWYTQHLKPRTWLKNVSCAGLIALSPFTSGSAALCLVLDGAQVSGLGSVGPAFGSLWRLVLTLFAGFMSREILMDVCDYEGDMETGIRTVPVKHGKRFAARVSLGFVSVLAVLATGVPALGILMSWDSVVAATSSYGEAIQLILKSPVARKFILAAIGSGMILRRAFQVAKTEGSDIAIASVAVDEQKSSSVLFILASFI